MDPFHRDTILETVSTNPDTVVFCSAYGTVLYCTVKCSTHVAKGRRVTFTRIHEVSYSDMKNTRRHERKSHFCSPYSCSTVHEKREAIFQKTVWARRRKTVRVQYSTIQKDGQSSAAANAIGFFTRQMRPEATLLVPTT